MKKLWLAIPLAILGALWAAPMQAASISVVALPNAIGIPEVVLVIALLGFALWKTSWVRILLSICLIIWGAFALPYDVKIGGPLIAIGTVLFIMGILALIKSRREQEG